MTQCAAFWLARFDNEEDLINYIEYHHDADGNASSPLADALGQRYDDDFLECVYTDPEDLAEEVGDFSGAEHFGAALTGRLRSIGGEWNTLLMLSGTEDGSNAWLFGAEPAESPAPQVRFAGRFMYEAGDE